MAVVNGYTTLALAREALSLNPAAIDHDGQVEDAITAASRDIDAHLGRRFYADAAVSTRVYCATDRAVLDVDDISTATGLIVKSDDDADGTFETTWDATEYQTEPLNGVEGGIEGLPIMRLRAFDRWFPSAANGRPLVQVTATWGWPAVPAAVTAACLAQLVGVYKAPEQPSGVASFDQFGAIRARPIHPTAARLLEPFDKSPIVVA